MNHEWGSEASDIQSNIVRLRPSPRLSPCMERHGQAIGFACAVNKVDCVCSNTKPKLIRASRINMDQIKLQTFFKKHVADLVVLCRNEWRYGFDDHKKQIDPLISVSDALGIDTTELRGACKALEKAQSNLRSVRDEYLARLERMQEDVDYV